MAHAVRVDNLREILKRDFHGRIAELARKIGKSDTQVGQWLNPPENPRRKIGERMARHIEAQLKLGRGALDVPGMLSAGTLSDDELEHLRDYRRARSSWKLVLRFVANVPVEGQEEAAAAINEIIARYSRSAEAAGYGRPMRALTRSVHEPAPYSGSFARRTSARRDKTTGKK